MAFLDDPKFRDITTQLSYQCTEEKLRDLINDADTIWLNKCGNAFVRNAISIIYNRHYYEHGSHIIGFHACFISGIRERRIGSQSDLIRSGPG